MIDTGVKHGSHLFDYRFQSQDPIHPLNRDDLIREEAERYFMVQNNRTPEKEYSYLKGGK